MDTATGLARANHNVDVKVFHGTVQHFLYCHWQAVNLIYKEDITRLKVI